MSQQVSELEPILSITREVMELTITEEDLEVVKTGEYTWAYTHENGPITLK